MAIVTTFHHGPPAGPHALILQHGAAFAAWYAAKLRDSPDARFTPEILRLAEAVAAGAGEETQAVSAETALRLDRLSDAFCFSFSNEQQLLPSAHGASQPRQDYGDAAPWLGQQAAPFVQRMWGYLLRGRGIGRDAAQFPYESASVGGDTMGFWTAAEVVHLATALGRLSLPPEAAPQAALIAAREALDSAAKQGGSLIMRSS